MKQYSACKCFQCRHAPSKVGQFEVSIYKRKVRHNSKRNLKKLGIDYELDEKVGSFYIS